MRYYGIISLYPVNGRGSWLKGFEELSRWHSDNHSTYVNKLLPLPQIKYSVKNKKLLKDCIAVTGSGLLISEKALIAIQTLNLPNHLYRPLSIHTNDSIYKYFLFNFDIFKEVVILEKTPFWDYATNEYAYVTELKQGLENGTPTPERGVWLYKSIINSADLFMFYVNSQYRCFVNDHFVSIIEANKLTGFTFESVDDWLVVE